jgi:type IV secretory pathway VirJ component
MRVELDATRAERDAARAALDGERSASRGWEDAAARAESSLAASRDELSALRATIAAEDRQSAVKQDDVEEKLKRLEVWDEQKSQLGDVIRRLASRTFGGENASAARTAQAPRAVRAGRATGENERAVPSKPAKVAVRAFR